MRSGIEADIGAELIDTVIGARQANLDCRVLRSKLGQASDQPARSKGRRRLDSQHTSGCDWIAAATFRQGAGQRGKPLLNGWQQRFSRRTQDHRPRQPPEQGLPQPGFQLAHLLADRCGRHM